MILLVTNERDITTDYVVLELRRRGIPFYRFNTERVASGALSFSPSASRGWRYVAHDGAVLTWADVTAAYFRRPGHAKAIGSVTSSVEREYCETEWNATLQSAMQTLHSRWLNSPEAIVRAENKPLQMQEALACGLLVPDTLLTNDFAAAADFAALGPTVGKTLRAQLLPDKGVERVIFTSRIGTALLDTLDPLSVQAAPVIYQREVAKDLDIRATVVGSNVFAAAIYSQVKDETQTDWRRGSHIDLRHEPHNLPSSVRQKCIQLTRQLGLRFGAIDLVLDKEGRYWFLELNPNGQWAWIENRTKLPITNAIVDELEGIANGHA